ncbi:hypothetical protein L4174_021255 [Photobacterium sp. CCB-ST2H9]|uniref:hypothetical protein n=1 Tax=Photobacterium sp. CCB-ST2H9 TaxID=2912855 RepID=UPI0020047E32|nr:hypothetical protein [Photobacterium sp. CCB-ST2H9]UTM59236.1 hypothetical protein L4174_021255 [Photobacterium sp. CCB-ST2H9]
MSNAQAILEQAQQAKAEAAELLKEVTRHSEDNLKLLSRCEAIVRQALVQVKPRTGSLEEQAVSLAMDSEKLAEAIRNRNSHDVAVGIMQLAMECKDVLHIHVSYAPHADELYVRVLPVTTQYQPDVRQVRLFYASFYFERDDIKNLLAIEDKLIELVAEARDNAEVQA